MKVEQRIGPDGNARDRTRYGTRAEGDAVAGDVTVLSSDSNRASYVDMTVASCVRKDLVEGLGRKPTTASLAAKAKWEGMIS